MPQEKPKYLLGPQGQELVPIGEVSDGPLSLKEEKTWQSIQKSQLFEMALRDTRSPAASRAKQPYCNHAWVFASAAANADNIAQVDFLIWEETEAEQTRRAKQSLRRGRVKHTSAWIPNRGKNRSILQRHTHTKRRFTGKHIKALEEDTDHPLSKLFRNPNPRMAGVTLWKATDVYYQLAGNCYWWLVTESGAPWFPGDRIERILVLHPVDMKPLIDQGTGVQVGWQFDVTGKSEGLGVGANGQSIRLMMQEVVHFRNFNMDHVVEGLSLINPAAGAIIQDIMAQQVNTAVLENGADPGGILTSAEPIDPREKRKIIKKWNDRHGGPHSRRKIAVLDGDLKWTKTGMTPEEMQFFDLQSFNRETVMAVLRTNKSVLGLTEDINHATHLAQDRAFWQRSLLPRVRYYESVIDKTIMVIEPDSTVAAFKLEDVEALQEDITSKVKTVKELTGQEIHMPPGQALELVGIDVADYDGSEEALVPPLLTTIDRILEDAEDPPEDTVVDPNAPPPDEEPGDEEDEQALPRLRFERPEGSSLAHKRGMTSKVWFDQVTKDTNRIRDAFAKLVGAHEKLFRKRFRNHVFNLRRETLINFERVSRDKLDRVASGSKVNKDLFTPEEIETILFNLERAGLDITARTAPLYSKMIEDITDFTESELGRFFQFDPTDIQVETFLRRRSVMIRSVNGTIRRALRAAIATAIIEGAGFDQLQNSIRQVFNQQVSPFRELRIARTETAQTMSGVRSLIFAAEGVKRVVWATAGDEKVREAHVILGSTGPQNIGHNFMEDLGEPGTLLYPTDPDGPPRQVINCRCVLVPVG